MRIGQQLSLAVILAAGCFAQATRPQARDVTLIEGRGELLTFQRDVNKVVISEPKTADAVVVSPREVMVVAKATGRATLMIWESGADPARWEIQVTKDTSDWDAFIRSLSEAAGAPISASGAGDTIVLSGKVKSAEDSKRLAGMAQARAKTVVNLLQAPPPPEPRQILLQVKFAAIDRAALTQVGFNLFSLNDKLTGVTSTQQFSAPRLSPIQTGNGSSSNTVNFSDLLNLFVYRPDLNIGATIKALQERNLLQMLAEPNLIAIEGKEASFIAGGQFPFPTITNTPTGGATSPVVTVQFKPFGIKLDFVPKITASGAIDLQVSPEVSNLDYANAVTLQGFVIPALSQRRADTEVILKDGESFAIAGLIDNRVVEVMDKIPGLGDVPILGRLFRSRSTQKSSDELLVVVTPRFVRPLSPDEKPTLPDMPATFLPTLPEQKNKGSKKNKSSVNEPEFVGPRGQQIPKQ
jgi:pilus assembly protein CpaC